MTAPKIPTFETPFLIKNKLPAAQVPLDITGKAFIFVAGLHRSGTSVLHRIIREHPEVTGFNATGSPEDEGQHLQSVYPVAKLFGGAGRFAFYPESRLTEESSLISAEAQRRLLCEWRPYLDESKRYIVEKSPPNLIRMRFLQALIPDCMFICIVRHPVAVAMATAKWSKTTISELIFHWLLAHEILVEDAPEIARITVIRYEDLVMDPNNMIPSIYDDLGLRAHKCTELVRNANSNYLSTNDTTIEHIAFLERIIWKGSIAERFGYSLVPPYVHPPYHELLKTANVARASRS